MSEDHEIIIQSSVVGLHCELDFSGSVRVSQT